MFRITVKGWSWSWYYCSWIYNYLCNQYISPLMLWVRISITARCTTLCDKVFQWLATGWWFTPGTPVSSTNNTDRHDITEILLKGADKYHASNKQTSNRITVVRHASRLLHICYFIIQNYFLHTGRMYELISRYWNLDSPTQLCHDCR